jgi:glutathione peroxidase
VMLLVNVATYWGFTYQYHELNALQEEFANDLVVLAFPCNQFGQVLLFLENATNLSWVM